MRKIDIATIQNELDNSPHGMHGAVVNRYAELLGVSKATIHRHLQKEFGRKKRIDRDPLIPQELIDTAAKYKAKGLAMGLSERELSTDLVIELMVDDEIEGADKLTVSTVNRRLRESGFRQVQPHQRIEAAYANQEHQMDFSRSKYFQLWKYDSSKDDYLLKVGEKTLFYKDDTKKLRTWMVGIIDSYSRIFLVKMFAATGESSDIGIDFLNWVYAGEHPEHPLQYLPDVLKTDNGSFIKDRSVKQMLEIMDIESKCSTPYKKRGIQKIESVWKILWRQFELKEAMKLGQGSTIHLKDYNELVYGFALDSLQKNHVVRSGTREHVYRSSLGRFRNDAGEVINKRVAECDLRDVAYYTSERVVSPEFIVSVDTEKYLCPEGTQGLRVNIFKNKSGAYAAKVIGEHSPAFMLIPTTGYRELDNFEHRPHATYVDRIEKEVKEEKEAKKAEAVGNINYMAPQVEKVTPVTPFNTAEDVEEEFVSVYDAKLYIAEKLVCQYQDWADIFDPLLSSEDGLLKSGIDKVIAAIKRQQAASS